MSTSPSRRLALSATIAVLGALALAPSAIASGSSNFCAGVYGAGAYCNQGHNHNLGTISATSDFNGPCVYRAVGGNAGSPSASGTYYCSPGGRFTSQDFHNLAGYAAIRNDGGQTSITGHFNWTDA